MTLACVLLTACRASPLTVGVPTPGLSSPAEFSPSPNASASAAAAASPSLAPPTLESEPPSPTLAAPTPEALPTAEVSAAPTASGRPRDGNFAWQRVDLEPERDGLIVSSALATTSGFIALGTHSHVTGGPWAMPPEATARVSFEGMIWTSPDGLGWTWQEVPEFDGALMKHLVESDGSFYAFGALGSCIYLYECPPPPDNAGNNVWRSTDGTDWQLLPQPQPLRAEFLSDVNVVDGTLVAVGLAVSRGSLMETEAGLWTSVDGTHWLPILDTPADAGLHAAVSDGSIIVAFQPPRSGEAPYLWAEDARGPWQSGPMPGAEIAYLRDAIAAHGLFVGVGGTANRDDGLQHPYAWVSSDGLEWRGEPLEAFLGSGFDYVTAVPAGFVALEGPYSESIDEGSEAWFSANGLDWQLLRVPADDRPFSVSAVAAGPLGVVAFGASAVVTGQDLWGEPRREARLRVWFAPASSFEP